MRTLTMTLVLAALAMVGQSARAGDCATSETTCCSQCGQHAACVEKTCQIVCEMKKEKKTCWCVECQEICPLMPGCRDCCDKCPPPRCGRPKTVKKLVKKEYEVEVPVYKCVVRHLCQDCCNGADTPVQTPSKVTNPPAAPQAAPLPPAPPAPVLAPKKK